MARPSGSAALAAVVSLVAGSLAAPGVAQAADPTTPLSAAEMAAALKAVAGPSTAAAAAGWKATITLHLDSISGSGVYAVDPPHGIAFDQLGVAGAATTHYAVAGKGLYENLAGASSRAAVKMMGRPAVRYVFTARKSLSLAAYVQENTPEPATVLTDDVAHPGTRTSHDDGSVDYALSDADGANVIMRVGPDGRLSGADVNDHELAMTVTYTYGPQGLTVPSAEATIGSTALAQGVAYLTMATDVRNVAHAGATDARRAAHGRTVKVASVRKNVRREMATVNTAARLKMVKAKDIRGGVRVSATNPWTHRTASYTVKASGKKVIVRGGA